MFNKLYEKIISFIKENYLWLLFYLVFITTMTYPLPYYIYTGGGTINIDDKIEMKEKTLSKGSYHMCYVSEIPATLPTYLLSYLIPSWDLVPKEEVTLTEKETKEDLTIRDQIYLQEANQNAVLTAYSYANRPYQIESSHPYIIYIDENSDTNLKIGDELLTIEGNKIVTVDDITQILNEKEIGDQVQIKIRKNNKEITKYATVQKIENSKKLGIMIETVYDYETTPTVNFHFSSNESGPSGGLMLSLAIYDKLVENDITKGHKIAGTGAIDNEGNVLSIGGVKYKLKGAVKEKADIFLVPNGENYEECIVLQKKYHYNIKIIGVDTFQEAITSLEKIKN